MYYFFWPYICYIHIFIFIQIVKQFLKVHYICIMILFSLTDITYILFQDKKRSRDSSVGGQPSKKRR